MKKKFVSETFKLFPTQDDIIINCAEENGREIGEGRKSIKIISSESSN